MPLGSRAHQRALPAVSHFVECAVRASLAGATDCTLAEVAGRAGIAGGRGASPAAYGLVQRRSEHGAQRLVQVRPEVIDVLDADGQADEVGGHGLWLGGLPTTPLEL